VDAKTNILNRSSPCKYSGCKEKCYDILSIMYVLKETVKEGYMSGQRANGCIRGAGHLAYY
jgi:hypothetical protein